jgi:hypothetical protein
MLDGTYLGLQASVADFLNRTDLSLVVPDLITLAETQLNRQVRVADMITSTTLSVSSASTALPNDYNGVISFELPPGTGAVAYEKPDGIRALRANIYTSAGTPIKWSIIGNNLETAPAPSGTFVCPFVYYSRLPPLSQNTTNWLLTKHPDAYLYGALLQSAPYLKDDPRLQSWGTLYTQAMNDIMAADGRVSFGHGFTPPFRAAAYPPGTEPVPAPAPALPGQ